MKTCRRTFLGLLAGSVLFPGVPKQGIDWAKIQDQIDHHYDTGYHERNARANMWQYQAGQGVVTA